jgi:hypothetical protein
MSDAITYEAVVKQFDYDPFTMADEIVRLRARLAAAEQDTERLNVLADEPIFEEFGYTGLDIYEVSSRIAEENGRDKPNKDDQRQAFRHLMDASIASPWSPDDE